ncbi:chorismate synthase [Marinifilum caeruleilacunae]|uniref:Chorismate synthase n=1 Tax=Marinifilum caeruleilacunae TaxID=2499076 RepID=A0ABX1WVS2_9BACT|nr:chorismate synthase [Marinifilum caeruleilacunae]NOU60206.1 chorismate synthase [Marinifilum caeruleilacunae]
MNNFGRIFRLSIFGESHGKGVGITIDGCPAGIPLTEEDLMQDLGRRKSGARGTTPRIEKDLPAILSGTFEGKTTGAPLIILFRNKNTQSKDYSNLLDSPRPGHADFVAQHKFGKNNDYTGGGHFSGRITLGIVAAGVVAKKILGDVNIDAKLTEIGGRTDFDAAIEEALLEHDSIGGIVECKANNLPIGYGEPFFDSVESMISHLIFAIPATKGIEFGSGFEAAKMKGSEHNDNFIDENGKTETNHAGGINGGITNGNELVFRVAIKPTSSIGKVQNTMNFAKGKVEELLIEGRHDACIALRIPVIIEAAAAIALADLKLIDQARR